MNKLDTKISRQARDIIQKYASGLFKDTTLEFYGIKAARIKELINVELPVIEVADSSTDYIFLLEDDTYLHFEFQTAYNKSDLTRFATYDIRLYERDSRKVITVIIYSSEVKKAAAMLEVGSLVYSPQKVMMIDYDGNAIYTELEGKIKSGQTLLDTDMLNLIFLPLMKHNIPKNELAAKSIGLAQTIPDKTRRDICIASIFAFGSKYLNVSEAHKLLEVLRMTDLATMMIEEREIEIAKKMLKRGTPLDVLAEDTGLDESTIKQLQAELDNE